MLLTEHIIDDINQTLLEKLECEFDILSDGFDVISNVLESYDINIKNISELDAQGDEFYIQIQDNVNLYVIYIESNDGYEFCASFVNDEELEAILNENDYLEDIYLDGF